jgi:hypothetical protein
MSWFRGAAGAAVVATAIGVAGCGGGSSTPTPSTPSAVTYTDLFSGNVTTGAVSYGTDNGNHFTVHAAGDILFTITKLSPLSTITVGLGVGTYDAATNTCTIGANTDAARLNVPLQLSGVSPREYCVAIYDVGNIVEGNSIDYEVSITHT